MVHRRASIHSPLQQCVVIIYLCLLTAVQSWQTNCTYLSTNGDYYDLSPLSKCDLSGYFVEDPYTEQFKLNICNGVKSGCSPQTAVCLGDEISLGASSTTSISDLGNKPGVVISYTDGDVCITGVRRTSVISLVCSPSANSPIVSFINEYPSCTYHFEIQSKEACPRTVVAPQLVICYINVFVVPFSHDDVGWIRTIQSYYEFEVKFILDSTVAALLENPTRKFTYVEQAFFTIWWNDLRTTDKQRNALRQMVKEGRWEFLVGSWVMPDEACTTYGAVIDQMTLGHQFLLNTFDVRPSKGFQIDPFGASSVIPVLEKLAGFDAHLIDRINNKDMYTSSQRLQFKWQGSPSLGKMSEIFTEIMAIGYCDWQFEFDFFVDPVNNKTIDHYAQKFINMSRERSDWYKTPNVLANWGCDFTFTVAHPEFHSMDLLIGWLQQNAHLTHVNVTYATLSEYFDAVWKEAPNFNVEWPELAQQGDFFPYFNTFWWTGFFTSRPQLKGYVRNGEAVSHLVEPLFSIFKFVFSFDYQRAYNNLYELRVANGYAQHHDGVTGTSVPEVVQMYENYLLAGIASGLETATEILNMWIQKPNGRISNLLTGTDAVSQISDGQTVSLVIFNSLGWSRSDVIKLPVNRIDLTVLDSNMRIVPSQISIAVGGNITSRYHLFFLSKLKGLSFQTYFIQSNRSQTTEGAPSLTKPTLLPQQLDTVISNSILSIRLSALTGLINRISNLPSGISINVTQNLLQYTSQHSNAYIFGPIGPATPISPNKPITYIAKGPIVTEISTIFPTPSNDTYAKQTIRMYSGQASEDVEQYIEMVFDIGPLPSHSEVIASFSSMINSDGIITTDDNGFEFIKRAVQWGLGIEANYFPFVYASYISDIFNQLSIIGERSHGVSSQRGGHIEVMLHRNPDIGDIFGPKLTDNSRVFPGLRVLFDSPVNAIRGLRRQSYLYNFPVTLFSTVARSPYSWISNYTTFDSLLSEDLPENIHLLSLNAVDTNATTAVILRLTHIYAYGEDTLLSQPVSVSLENLFILPIDQIIETTLTANTVINEEFKSSTDWIITLYPKQIRTFLIQFRV